MSKTLANSNFITLRHNIWANPELNRDMNSKVKTFVVLKGLKK